MTESHEILINFYSQKEEIANVWTHVVGACAAFAGFLVLIAFAWNASLLTLSAVSVYAFSLIAMYLFSTIYHAVRNDRLKLFFRRLDHCSIYLLIAGTYTPLLIMKVGGALAWGMLGVLWSLAGIGILIKFITMKEIGGLSLYLYLIMGWGGVLCMGTLFREMSVAELVCMFAGGVAYTSGVVFFVSDKPYRHTLWHLFVLAGSIFHFAMVLMLLIF